jgi:probable phosphoglycerate mutase
MASQERERPTVTRVLLVQHGETEWSREDRFAGTSDVTLSERGHWQAAQLAERLKAERLAAVYSSPLYRALETAKVIAAPHRLQPTVVDGLSEMDFGDWEGRSRSTVMAEYAPVYAAWTRDPATVRTPHGESGFEVATRAVAAVKELARMHVGATIVVSGHRTVNRLVLCQLLGIGLSGYRERLAQDDGALNCVDIDARGRGHLIFLNDTSHLVEDRGARQLSRPQPALEPAGPGEGACTWIVPDNYLPTPLNDGQALQSHEALCVLNTGAHDVHLHFDFFFEDRACITDVPVTVPAQRTLHIRLDRPEHLNGIELPRDVPFATRIRSDQPVVVQHSRLDTSQTNLALMTTIAYPVINLSAAGSH